ncbi:MAG: efflux RND transporter periplasmic adaptor subunit [Acidobacteria bacterium]|nr:efflux RND transporter periplasmic adaptor subunit [Acidobacteriota bacterium]
MNEHNGSSRSIRLWLVGILVTGLAILLWLYLRPREQDASVAAKARVASAEATNTPVAPALSKEPALVDVTTAAAITRNLERGLEVVGSLAADEEVLIGAQVPGELAELRVDFGSFVTAGQIIAQIDQRDAKLRIEQAEAALRQEKFEPRRNAEVKIAEGALDLATVELDRAAKLVEKGDIARAVFDQARINHSLAQARHQAAIDAVNQQLAIVEQQRAALQLARKSLTDTVVRAPITGAVKEKFAARGAYLPVGGRILSLVKIAPLRLRADVPEYATAAVRVGQLITLRVEAFPEEKFSGRVVRIGAALSEQTRALTIEAQVANPRNLLRPGMFAKSNLVLNRAAPVVLVPQKAVVNASGLTKVFVVESGRTVERVVRTGVSEGELVEISEGVREGELVATSNTDKLQQGSLIRATN